MCHLKNTRLPFGLEMIVRKPNIKHIYEDAKKMPLT